MENRFVHMITSANAEQRLKDLGIGLPHPPTPLGAYVEAVQTGSLLFLSGTLPVESGTPKFLGRIGSELSVEDGRRATRLAALNALALARNHMGSLDRVKRVVRVGISLATTPEFREHPKVADAASELLASIFGVEMISTRLVFGMTSLPLGVYVVLESIFEIADRAVVHGDSICPPAFGAVRRDASRLETTPSANGYSPPAQNTRRDLMSSYIKVGQENSTPIEVYYEDHGSGPPVVLIHGWPLNGASWEKQSAALLAAGHRVITYDRRGFGRSSKPAVGYDYDTFAADLDALLSKLDLTDICLVGFSMGTGEVTRYIGKHGTKRIRKAVLIGTLGPYLVKTADNPEGVDKSVFEGIKAAIKADRPALLMDFLRNFYNYDVTGGKLVSERVLEDNWNVATGASAIGTLACVDAWIEDFRQDIARNTVPTLILHGDADRILPPDASSRRQAKMIRNAKFVELKGGPHGVLWTHADQINSELVKFLA